MIESRYFKNHMHKPNILLYSVKQVLLRLWLQSKYEFKNIFFRSHEAYHGESYQGGKAFDRPKKSRFAFSKNILNFLNFLKIMILKNCLTFKDPCSLLIWNLIMELKKNNQNIETHSNQILKAKRYFCLHTFVSTVYLLS